MTVSFKFKNWKLSFVQNCPFEHTSTKIDQYNLIICIFTHVYLSFWFCA